MRTHTRIQCPPQRVVRQVDVPANTTYFAITPGCTFAAPPQPQQPKRALKRTARGVVRSQTRCMTRAAASIAADGRAVALARAVKSSPSGAHPRRAWPAAAHGRPGARRSAFCPPGCSGPPGPGRAGRPAGRKAQELPSIGAGGQVRPSFWLPPTSRLSRPPGVPAGICADI